jgi:aldehyde:ferredoxin oxidoreductase
MNQGKGQFALSLPRGHKPEYETLAAFGSMTLNDNIEAIIKANELCNEYGLDTISTGCTVSYAIECYENEIISPIDTGGLELRWGNAAAIVELTRQIGAREGFGAFLADGIRVATQKLGPEAITYAIHVQGEEVAMHDPRFLPDLATTYLMDATPGRHTQGGALVAPPDMKFDYDKYDYAGAVHAQAHRAFVNITHVLNSAGVCLFGVSTFGYKVLLEQLRAVTGWKEMTDEDFMRTGERIAVIRHAFNLREGLNPLRRNIPGRLVGKPPLTTGPLKGVTLDYAAQLRAYLKEVDWDPRTTVPSPAALRALGLEELIPDLQRANVPAVETF